MNQYLVDYTVRNLTTGDEEEIRVLELEPAEFEGFPEAVRGEIRDLVGIARAQWTDLEREDPWEGWTTAQDRILDLLLPYISRPQLYGQDYEAWEAIVLDVADDELAALDRVRAQRLLDSVPPEDIGSAVRAVLEEAVEAAIENWAEGFWDQIEGTTTRGDVLGMLVGFIQAWQEGADADDPSFATRLIQPGAGWGEEGDVLDKPEDA